MASKGDEAQRLIADPTTAAEHAKDTRRVFYLKATVAMASVLVVGFLYKSVSDNLSSEPSDGKIDDDKFLGNVRGLVRWTLPQLQALAAPLAPTDVAAECEPRSLDRDRVRSLMSGTQF